jgi:hypothetical protein
MFTDYTDPKESFMVRPVVCGAKLRGRPASANYAYVKATPEEVAVIVRKCLLNGGYSKTRWEHKHWDEHPKLNKGTVEGFDDLYKWMLAKIIKPNRGICTSDLDLDDNAHVLEAWFGSAWVQVYKVPPEALWYYVNQWWSFFMSGKSGYPQYSHSRTKC